MLRQQGRINEVCGKLAQDCSRTGANLSLLGFFFFFPTKSENKTSVFPLCSCHGYRHGREILSVTTNTWDAARSDWSSEMEDETWTDVEKQMFSQMNDCMYLNVVQFDLYEDLLELWLSHKQVILHCSAPQWSDLYLFNVTRRQNAPLLGGNQMLCQVVSKV